MEKKYKDGDAQFVAAITDYVTSVSRERYCPNNLDKPPGNQKESRQLLEVSVPEYADEDTH